MNINYVGCRVRPFIENSARYMHTVSAVDSYNDADADRFAQESGGRLHLVEGIDADNRWNSISRGYEKFDAGDVIFCGPVEATPQVLKEAAKKYNVHNASFESVSKVREIPFLKSVAVGDILFPATGYGRQGRRLIKNIYGAGGTSVRDYQRGALPDSEYIQEYIEGESVGASFVTSRGETSLLGITRHLRGIKYFGQPEFWFGGLVYPFRDGDALRERVEKFGKLAGGESRLAGVWGADFILGGDGRLWLLEINPRFTSSLELIAMAHGIDIARLQVESVRGDYLPDSLPDPENVIGTAVCYAPEDFRFELVGEADQYLRDIPRQGTLIRRGEPVLSVYAEGEGDDDCMERLKKRAAPFLGKSAHRGGAPNGAAPQGGAPI